MVGGGLGRSGGRGREGGVWATIDPSAEAERPGRARIRQWRLCTLQRPKGTSFKYSRSGRRTRKAPGTVGEQKQLRVGSEN